MNTYDIYYPHGKHDEYRICARLNPKTGRVCGVRYRQWSSLQNKEPWTDCERCERMFNPIYNKKKNKK